MLFFALVVAPIAAFVACVAVGFALAGVPMSYAAGVLVAPGLTTWRARRAGCSPARTTRLATMSLAIAVLLVAVAIFVLLARLSSALTEFG